MRRINNYNTLKQDETADDQVETDGNLENVEEAKFFDTRSEKLPKTTLFLIFFLFFCGIVSNMLRGFNFLSNQFSVFASVSKFTMSTSILIMLGHLDNKVYEDRMWPLLILGILMLIPGSYYAVIVYFVVKKRPGYSYDMIPSCT
jgi:hypothetical protein